MASSRNHAAIIRIKVFAKINGKDHRNRFSILYLIDPDTQTPPTEFQSIYKLWHSKRTNGLFPCWQDFDFTDFVGWHGMLIISETNWTPFEITYRLFGSEIANIIGEDMTGKKSYSGEESSFFLKTDEPYLNAIRDKMK